MQWFQKLVSNLTIFPKLLQVSKTQTKIGTLERKIFQEIQDNDTKIYYLPECDSNEDEDFKHQVQELRDSMPLAVVGANAMVDVRGKKIRERLYPVGVVEVENW